jgi:hypothetical protein
MARPIICDRCAATIPDVPPGNRLVAFSPPRYTGDAALPTYRDLCGNCLPAVVTACELAFNEVIPLPPA